MYEYKVSITKVVDGDTVDVDIDLGFGMTYKKQRVRLMGIDQLLLVGGVERHARGTDP